MAIPGKLMVWLGSQVKESLTLTEVSQKEHSTSQTRQRDISPQVGSLQSQCQPSAVHFKPSIT
jgi:hypothetical protein